MFRLFAITLRKFVNFLLKHKEVTFNVLPVRELFLFIAIVFCLSASAVAQVIPGETGQSPADTTSLPDPDVVLDDLANDSLQIKSDTIKSQVPKGDIETTIEYSARDSIRASVDGKKIWLYGEAKIVYGEIKLEADEILINYGENTLTANGTRDSLGNRVGYPVFTDGADVYETKDIVYNFKTRRARISEVVTEQGGGYLHADAAFKNEKNEILSVRNSYTTCNLEHPHFRIRATKTKAIPDDKIVSGPFYMEFNDIPLPAAFLFGMFPSKQSSSSGILFPSYGEEKRRGFNLRNGGYFFDINEYIKLAITGDIYSKGGHAVRVAMPYIKRYSYSGNLNFAYSKTPDSDDKIETDNPTSDFRLSWSHSPQSKGTGRFAASVTAATASYNKNNNLMYGNTGELYTSQLTNISTKLSSNISYSKRFTGTPFSLGINLSHNQDLQTKLVDLQLPSLTLNMTNQYPFQGKFKSTSPLENFSFSYSMAGANRITNNLGRIPPTASRDSIAPFTVDNFSTFLENGRKGIRHAIPISTSMKALRYFTVSPNMNYEEKWYGEYLEWEYDKTRKTIVKTDTTKGFNRIANYSFGVGLNTRIYGMYEVKNPNRSLKAIRHIVNPSVSFSYTPDFTGNENYFDKVTYVNDNSDTVIVFKSRHEGFLYGGSNTSRSGSIGFGIGNNVEAKVMNEKDSVARKVMLLNNLSINGSYNLLAESFNLSNISMSANTNLLDNKLNLNLSATLDPYRIITQPVDPENPNGASQEVRINSLAFRSGSLGRITNASLNLSTSLNPKARDKQNSSREKIGKSDLPEQEKEFLLQNPDAYIDFEIPWNLNLGYNISYVHSLNSDPRIVQHLQASGDFSLSEKWKFNYTTGYDFEKREFTPTSLGIARDLHCWTMRLNWVPFGYFQNYNFTIAVKSSILQDLKLERRRSFFDSF